MAKLRDKQAAHLGLKTETAGQPQLHIEDCLKKKMMFTRSNDMLQSGLLLSQSTSFSCLK